MRRLSALIVGLALALGGVAHAWAITCDGTSCGGAGGPLGQPYAYEIVIGAGEQLNDFLVGTDDFLIQNVNSILPDTTPIPGWGGGWSGGNEQAYKNVATPHGLVSPGWDGFTTGLVFWSGPILGPGTYWFSFDSSALPQDVGWQMTPQFGAPPPGPGAVIFELWTQPVGVTGVGGAGPVHGPSVPEPSTYILLAGGMVGLALVRRKTKK